MNLFDWSKSVRRDDPETSREAASSVADVAAWQHQRILYVLRSRGAPLAAEQIADCTDDLDKVLVGRRMCELECAGLIVKTAQRHKNRSGRSAFRYAIKGAE